MAQNFKPKSDQPRVSGKDLARSEAAPTIQYKINSIRSMTPRASSSRMKRS